MLQRVFIVGASRTPFGAYGGSLKDFTQEQLAVIASQSALTQSGVSASSIDNSCFGNVVSSTVTGAYLARHIALQVGVAQTAPALTVNRLCGSGFEAVIQVAKDIHYRDSAIALAGGTEHMSGAPFAMYNTRFGIRLGSEPKLQDVLWSSLTDCHINMPMAMTAEKLAEMYKITRDDVDRFALRSQQTWAAADAAGFFKSEIAPITLKSKKGPVSMTKDEHGRADATLESLQKLPTVFKKDGVVTAGNASGIVDGAAAVVVAGESAVEAHKLTPLARIVGWHVSGVDPSIMGIGPVPAIRELLKKTNLKMEQIDLWEVNEAFAAQFLAVEKELNLPREKTNCEGGAISIGHPLGASGTRILVHLAHALNKKKKKYAIGSACIGGGQGIAVLLERV